MTPFSWETKGFEFVIKFVIESCASKIWGKPFENEIRATLGMDERLSLKLHCVGKIRHRSSIK